MADSTLTISGVQASAISAGIKSSGAPDLCVVVLAEDTTTAAVFTQNVFCAAPVLLAKNHLNSPVKALLINSGNANAGTGTQGMESALKTCALLAEELGVEAEQVLPFSTGVIGQQLDLSKFESGIPQAVSVLSDTGIEQLAKGILTTDLVKKTASAQFEVDGKTVSITGVAKGSGMIRPDMATMLSFVFTDVQADFDELQACLTQAANQSFNRITVDGDTSTNDACTLSATGRSGVKLSDCAAQFQQALNQVSQSLAQQIVRDGEGATKFVEVRVKGGASNEDCLEVAYTVAHSPLVKTALFASDANWGRILAAVGRANIAGLNITDINIYLNTVRIIKAGEPDVDYSEAAGSAEFAKDEIIITIEIGQNNTQESVWTCDFSYDYVKINAEYRT